MTNTQDDMSFESIDCDYNIVELNGKENCSVLNSGINDIVNEVNEMFSKQEELRKLLKRISDFQTRNIQEERTKDDLIGFFDKSISKHFELHSEYIKSMWKDIEKNRSELIKKKSNVSSIEKKPKLPQTINGHSLGKVFDTAVNMQRREIETFISRLNDVNKKVSGYIGTISEQQSDKAGGFAEKVLNFGKPFN